MARRNLSCSADGDEQDADEMDEQDKEQTENYQGPKSTDTMEAGSSK